MSTTIRAREVPRTTACPCRIISSSVTPVVFSIPCMTMPTLSPTRMKSACFSTMAAVWAW